MHEVIWAPDALADLDRHFAALNERDPNIASRAIRAITAAAARLAVFPNRGVTIEGTNQQKLSVAFGKYGYVLY